MALTHCKNYFAILCGVPHRTLLPLLPLLQVLGCSNSDNGSRTQNAAPMESQAASGLLLAIDIRETSADSFQVSCKKGEQVWTEPNKSKQSLIDNEVCTGPAVAPASTAPVAPVPPIPEVPTDTIKIKGTTFLKGQALQSTTPGLEKCYLGTSNLGASAELKVAKLKAGDNQAGHLKITLPAGQSISGCTLTAGFIFGNDLETSDAVRLGLSAAAAAANPVGGGMTTPVTGTGATTTPATPATVRTYSVVMKADSVLKPNTDSTGAHAEWAEGSTKCKVTGSKSFNVTTLRKSTASDAGSQEAARTDHLYVEFAKGQAPLDAGCNMTRGFIWSGHLDTTVDPVKAIMAGQGLPQ